ncbi:MAG: glutamate formimidoyltransferase [Spirochaetia bacterium]|jgi:glutamate formiminotransferase/formiminotetrahydrofolate cyclodeaminase|nr:glutamate formimidoyltransferase [Spirochaetia bacterium]
MLENAVVECVPNFSEGRNQHTIQAIAEAITSVRGAALLDVDTGTDTNRTVYTFAGKPPAVVEAALAAARTARALINMEAHKGSHPRMGALDVCPFIPVSGISMAECAQLARDFGRRLALELGVPVYLYEEAAAKPSRRSLAQIRSGEYEGLAAKLTDPEWLPDFGPARFDPRWGATVTGAREILLAFNVNLNTEDVSVAKTIALELRESGKILKNSDGSPVLDATGGTKRVPGRLKAVRAIGWHVQNLHCAQVSMNILDYKITPLWTAYEAVVQEAERLGYSVSGSELVGLAPAAALVESGRYFQRKEKSSPGLPDRDLARTAVRSMGLDSQGDFDLDKKIIEWAYRGRKRLMDNSVSAFADELSSPSPAPGGGTASACMGALGAALAAMVANLSIGKKGFEERTAALESIAMEAQGRKTELLSRADEDSDAFNDILKALRLPKDKPEEREKRRAAIQEATKQAALVPLGSAQACLRAMELCLLALEQGRASSATDAAVGFLAAKAGMEGALLNVKINLQGIEDSGFVVAAQRDIETLSARLSACEKTYRSLLQKTLGF